METLIMIVDTARAVPWPVQLAASLLALVLLAGLAWVGKRTLGRVVAAGRRNDLKDSHLGLLVIAIAALLTSSYGVVGFFNTPGRPLVIAICATVVFEGGMLAFKLARMAAVRAGKLASIVAMYSTAGWGMVGFSVFVNVSHGLAFVAFPLGGAAVVEIISRDLLTSQQEYNAGEGAHIGPGKILAALWRRGWTALAVRAGAADTASVTEIDGQLRADRAARAMYRLIRLGHRRVPDMVRERARARATKAINRAGIGTDPRQGARMAAHLHVLTSTRQLADEQLWQDPQRAARRVIEVASIPAWVEASTPHDSPLMEAGSTPLDRTGIEAGSRPMDRGDIEGVSTPPASIRSKGARVRCPLVTPRIEGDRSTPHRPRMIDPGSRGIGPRSIEGARVDPASPHRPLRRTDPSRIYGPS